MALNLDVIKSSASVPNKHQRGFSLLPHCTSAFQIVAGIRFNKVFGYMSKVCENCLTTQTPVTLHQAVELSGRYTVCLLTPTAAARLRNPTLAGLSDSTTVGAALQTTPVHITVDSSPRVELTLACCCKHEPSRCLIIHYQWLCFDCI